MKRGKRTHANHERWLVSYADFITLLFAFFVVLYASAQVDKGKVGELSASIHTAFEELGSFRRTGPGTGTSTAIPSTSEPTDVFKLRNKLREALSQEIARNEVSIYLGREGLVVSLREVGFFDTGSAHIRPEAQHAFGRIVSILRQGNYHLRIEGHTDNIPIHNAQFSSNWELSTARATEVVRVMMMQYDFPPENLAAAGYGEFHPVAQNNTPEGRQINRRVDVVVLGRADAKEHLGR
jgi:chemotaxis protein MotB